MFEYFNKPAFFCQDEAPYLNHFFALFKGFSALGASTEMWRWTKGTPLADIVIKVTTHCLLFPLSTEEAKNKKSKNSTGLLNEFCGLSQVTRSIFSLLIIVCSSGWMFKRPFLVGGAESSMFEKLRLPLLDRSASAKGYGLDLGSSDRTSHLLPGLPEFAGTEPA
jgi:hypothetical protein